MATCVIGKINKHCEFDVVYGLVDGNSNIDGVGKKLYNEYGNSESIDKLFEPAKHTLIHTWLGVKNFFESSRCDFLYLFNELSNEWYWMKQGDDGLLRLEKSLYDGSG